MQVLVLGAGFGGLELTTRLSEEFGTDIDITLIDQSDSFVFGFSKLDVMFGRLIPSAARHPYRDFVKPGVRFVQSTIRSIDPAAKRVETDAGTFDADILVVALGADLHPDATPGLVEGGNEFYTVEGAFALREILPSFEGGRVIVGVTSAPFKCPPAPSETALLMHDFLTERGIRDQCEIALVMPLPVPIPPSPAASKALLDGVRRTRDRLAPKVAHPVARPEPQGRRAQRRERDAVRPLPRRARAPRPAVVAESALAVDGWIPVNPLSLETAVPGVFAVGDVTSVGTPKAGVFAEGQAAVAADHIIGRIRGSAASAEYDGHGLCYLEFGHDQVAKVDVTFLSGQAPVGDMDGPSQAFAADKAEFGTSRIQRWFGRAWTGVDQPTS